MIVFQLIFNWKLNRFSDCFHCLFANFFNFKEKFALGDSCEEQALINVTSLGTRYSFYACSTRYVSIYEIMDRCALSERDEKKLMQYRSTESVNVYSHILLQMIFLIQ